MGEILTHGLEKGEKDNIAQPNAVFLFFLQTDFLVKEDKQQW